MEEAVTVKEVKTIRDKSEALRLYVKQVGDGLMMQNYCAELKVRSERKAGTLLKEAMRVGNPQWSPDATIDRLGDMGVSKSQSSR